MRRLKEILKNNKEKIFVLGDQAIVSGSNFIIGILLARFLGLDSYGVYVLGWMAILFSSSIHLAFIIKPLFTLYPKQNNKNEYLASLMGIQIIFSALTFLLVYAVASIVLTKYPEWSSPWIEINLALASSLFVLSDYIRRLFFVLHKPFSALIHDMLNYALLFTILAFVIFNDQLSISTAFMATNAAMAAAIAFSLIKNYSCGITFENFNETIYLNWSFSKYLVGTSLLQLVSGNLFIVMAGGIIGPLAVGAIRMVQNIIGVLHVLFLAMENIVPLRASEVLQKEGRHKMFQYVIKIGKQALIPAGILITLIVVFSSQIIDLLYGSEYIQFKELLTAFAVLYIFVFFGTLLRFIIRTFENNKIIFYSYVLTAIFSILLASPLIKQFGLSGVMAGLFLMQFLTIGMYLYSLKSELKCLLK